MDSTRNNDSVAAKYAKTSTWIAFCTKNNDVDRRNTTPGDSRERSRSKMTTLIDEIRRKFRKLIWKCFKNQKKARARPTSEKPEKKKTRKNNGGARKTDFLAYSDRWSKKSIQWRSQLLAKSAKRAQKEVPGCVAVLWRCAQKGRKCSFLKTPKSRNTKQRSYNRNPLRSRVLPKHQRE